MASMIASSPTRDDSADDVEKAEEAEFRKKCLIICRKNASGYAMRVPGARRGDTRRGTDAMQTAFSEMTESNGVLQLNANDAHAKYASLTNYSLQDGTVLCRTLDGCDPTENLLADTE